MKKLVIVIFIYFLSTDIYAEEIKVLFHLNEKMKAPLLISNVSNYLSSNPYSKIVVVVNGSAVLRLVRGGGMDAAFQNLINAGVEIGACNNTIIANKIKGKHIVSGVTILREGGISRLVQLQLEGYVYIKI